MMDLNITVNKNKLMEKLLWLKNNDYLKSE